LRKLFYKAEVDRAVFFGILAKIWGLVAGPFTALLIVIRFTPEYQGYYYTFNSLLAIQIFVELGLTIVISQFASHEWSKLRMDDSGGIAGDKEALSRLASLAKVSSKWYMVGGIIIAFCLGLGGYIFFLHSHNTAHINWPLPWFFLCFFTGVSFSLTPLLALLEGCNQVSAVYTYRFFQGVIASLVLCITIFMGANLWSASISVAAVIFYTALFIKRRYWKFISCLLFTGYPGPRIDWRKEILPMQWRIAISTLGSYFTFFLFTPVIFNYYGPVVAGQFGITWSLALTASTISSSWIFPKIPRFAILIAEKKYSELDSLFSRVTKIFVINTLIAASGAWFLVYILNRFNHPFAARLLPLLPTTLFLMAQVIIRLSLPFTVYLRAHKKEPILWLVTGGAVLTAFSTFILGKYYSVAAIGFGSLLINIAVVISLVLLWHRCRIEWHVDTGAL